MSFSNFDSEAPKSFALFSQNCIDAAKNRMSLDLRYDMESVRKLDGLNDIIGKPKNLGQMVTVIGSFLGEAFRTMYSGRWEWNDRFKSWAIMFRTPDGKEEGAFVFAKVEKRFVNGMEDSISFYAHVTDSMVKGLVKP